MWNAPGRYAICTNIPENKCAWSVRADEMVDADVVEASDLVALVARFFSNPAVAYLHVHNARRDCYAARVDRV